MERQGQKTTEKRIWEREQEHTYFYMCVKDFLLFSTLSSMTKAATQKFHFTPRLWWNNIFITINLIEIFKKITLSKLKCLENNFAQFIN